MNVWCVHHHTCPFTLAGQLRVCDPVSAAHFCPFMSMPACVLRWRPTTQWCPVTHARNWRLINDFAFYTQVRRTPWVRTHTEAVHTSCRKVPHLLRSSTRVHPSRSDSLCDVSIHSSRRSRWSPPACRRGGRCGAAPVWWCGSSRLDVPRLTTPWIPQVVLRFSLALLDGYLLAMHGLATDVSLFTERFACMHACMRASSVVPRGLTRDRCRPSASNDSCRRSPTRVVLTAEEPQPSAGFCRHTHSCGFSRSYSSRARGSSAT
jgi:hypothetical protein